MNKQAILLTAVLRIEEGLYVYASPLLRNCIGAAETKKEAWQHFVHHVETAYTAYLEGRLAGMHEHPGRPTKNATQVTLRVQPETHIRLAGLAKDMNCSQGEIADYLLAFYEAAEARTRLRPAPSTRKPAIRKVAPAVRGSTVRKSAKTLA